MIEWVVLVFARVAIVGLKEGTRLEPLLDERGELPDSATLLSEDLLGVGRSDDDLRSGVRHSDLAARVTLLSELSGEELVDLSLENSVGYRPTRGKDGSAHSLLSSPSSSHILLVAQVDTLTHRRTFAS